MGTTRAPRATKKNIASSNVISFSGATKSTTTSGGASKTKKSKYHYPKSLLVQKYFCNHGANREFWSDPDFTLSMLGDENFVSPMGALLDQLEAEGHNVKGARIEWLAFRDLASHYKKLFWNLAHGRHESTVAKHLYKSSDR